MDASDGENLEVFGFPGLAWFLSLCKAQKGFFCYRIVYSRKCSHNTFLVFLLFVFLHLNLNLDGNCGILGNCDS